MMDIDQGDGAIRSWSFDTTYEAWVKFMSILHDYRDVITDEDLNEISWEGQWCGECVMYLSFATIAIKQSQSLFDH